MAGESLRISLRRWLKRFEFCPAPLIPDTKIETLVNLDLPPGNVSVAGDRRIFFAYHPFAQVPWPPGPLAPGWFHGCSSTTSAPAPPSAGLACTKASTSFFCTSQL